MPSYWQPNKPELKHKAESRGLAVLSTAKRGSEPSKADYVRALEAADRKPACFLSLPPELKMMICGELLTFEHSERTCHPQILRTRKEINAEATELLYGANVFQVDVTKDYVQAHGKTCGRFGSKNWIEHLEWPDFLRKVKKLHIKVAATTPSRVNHVFYSLCAHLGDQYQLTGIEADIRSLKLDEGSRAYGQTIWPLTLLNCSLGMKAQVADDKTVVIHSSLKDNSLGLQHRTDTLAKAVSISKEARSYTELTKRAEPRHSYLDYHQRRPYSQDTEYPELERARSMLDALLASNDFFDESWERLTRDAINTLRKVLAALNVNAVIQEQEKFVNRALESLSELRLQREKFQVDEAEVEIREKTEETRRARREAEMELEATREQQESERRARDRAQRVPLSARSVRGSSERPVSRLPPVGSFDPRDYEGDPGLLRRPRLRAAPSEVAARARDSVPARARAPAPTATPMSRPTATPVPAPHQASDTNEPTAHRLDAPGGLLGSLRGLW